MNNDLGQAFRKFIDKNFITINGCLVERVFEDTFKWGDYTGTFSEVAEKIREAGKDLQNSLKQQHGK